MSNFKIEIIVKFLGDVKSISFVKKDYIYHSNADQNYKDSMIFSQDKIEISGKRSKTIDTSEFLYTQKSRVYRECLSSLLYVYYKFGSFEIKSIKLNGFEVSEPNQKFQMDQGFRLDEDILSSLFDYRNDSLYIPLIHLTEGLYNDDYKLEHSWKAFNFIYNEACDSEDDKQSYVNIFENMCQDTVLFQSVFNDAQDLILNGGLDTGKAIAYMCKNNSKQLTNFASFWDIFEVSNISDENFLEFLKGIFEKIFENRYRNTKEYRDVIKNFKKKISKKEVKIQDYLRFLLNYTFYLRNKSMHGVFQSPSFLFETEYTKQLSQYSNFISSLCFSLLKNDIYTRVKSSSNTIK